MIDEYRYEGCIPVWEETGVYNFYLKIGEAELVETDASHMEEVHEPEGPREPDHAPSGFSLSVRTVLKRSFARSIRVVPKRRQVNALGEESDVICGDARTS